MPLLLITLPAARHCGLRHRCKFRWLVDSQFAINWVTSVTSPQYGPTNQPDNADYLSVIRELHTELQRPLSMKWIKSHQDEKREYYTKLSQGAQHNVNVDGLATKFHSLPKAKPSRTTAHIPATNKSIAINRMRFYGNLDANIRFHINGGYIRNYLQTKHSWANRAWDKINMPAFGGHMEKLSAPHHMSHVKFIHDILSLGNHKLHLSKTKDPTIRLCPCCLTNDEVRTTITLYDAKQIRYGQQHSPNSLKTYDLTTPTRLARQCRYVSPILSKIQTRLFRSKTRPETAGKGHRPDRDWLVFGGTRLSRNRMAHSGIGKFSGLKTPYPLPRPS